ncbi:UNVERIFIED_CONTAM: hypothetical protein FKN15_068463 [Acipenser sinensis]
MSSTQDAPSFFKNMGSGSPKPRQKFCGMFCPVEGSTDNKTLDFGSLTAGRGLDVAGARNTNRVIAQQRDISTLDRGRKVEIRSGSGKEALQNLNDQYCTYPIVPQYCTYPIAPQYCTYPIAPQYCTYTIVPQYCTYPIVPQYCTYPIVPQYCTYPIVPQYCTYPIGPQYCTYPIVP